MGRLKRKKKKFFCRCKNKNKIKITYFTEDSHLLFDLFNKWMNDFEDIDYASSLIDKNIYFSDKNCIDPNKPIKYEGLINDTFKLLHNK